MSATPRTDALLASIPGYENDEDWPHIAIDPVMGLCRELERELAAQVVYVEALKEALSVIAGEPHRDDTYVGMSPVQVARAALHGVCNGTGGGK